MTRAATPADVVAVRDLIAACEQDLFGRVDITADWVRAHLSHPGLALKRDSQLVHDDEGELVAWATVRMGRRATVHVHPGSRGRGLGARLLDFTEARAVEQGGVKLAQMVWDADTAAVKLLDGRGYIPGVTEWLLAIPLDGEPAVPPLPQGLTLRTFRDGDGPMVHAMMECAFGEWQVRSHPYEEWARQTVELDTFTADLSPLIFDGDRLVAGLLSLNRPDSGEGYVERLAVDGAYRHRGLARLLLRYAFRGFYQHGRRSCTLYTHSDTGAVTLYERVGMAIRRSSTLYSRTLPA